MIVPCRAAVKVCDPEDDVVCKEGEERKVPSSCDGKVDGDRCENHGQASSDEERRKRNSTTNVGIVITQ
jgi:hypothetical protein